MSTSKLRIKSLLIQISIFSFIFLWDVKYDLYQLRYLIIIPLLFSAACVTCEQIAVKAACKLVSLL